MSLPARKIMLPRAFLRQCRKQLFAKKIADSTGVEMTGGSLLMRTLIFRRLLLRKVLADDERFVGLLIPPSAGGVLANAAVTIAGRVVGQSQLHRHHRDAQLLHRPVRHPPRAHQPAVHGAVRLQARRRAGVSRRPARAGHAGRQARGRRRHLRCCRPPCSSAGSGCTSSKFDDLMTIIYTSGSTGKPKGVMLSFGNVGSNSAAHRRHPATGRLRHGLRHSAAVSLDGLYRRPVVGAGLGRSRRVSLQPAGAESDRQAVPRPQGDDHGHHAHVFAFLHAALHARGVRHD